MPVSRVTTWNSLDILTATALNGEFNAVMNNCVSLTGSETLTNKTLTSPVINTPTLTTPRFADGGHIDDVNGNELLVFDSVGSAVNYISILNNIAGQTPAVRAGGDDTNISLVLESKGTGSVSFSNQTNFLFAAYGGTGVVNRIATVAAATGITPTIQAEGGDTNIGLQLASKGTGNFGFVNSTGNILGLISGGASIVNYLNQAPSVTGVAVALQAAGSDTNIDLKLTPKGTGVIDLSSAEVTLKSQDPPTANRLTRNGVCRGWIHGASGGTSNADYNVSSVSKPGTGSYTVNWDTDFASANYAAVGVPETNGAHTVSVLANAASNAGVTTFTVAGAATDMDWAVTADGAQ